MTLATIWASKVRSVMLVSLLAPRLEWLLATMQDRPVTYLEGIDSSWLLWSVDLGSGWPGCWLWGVRSGSGLGLRFGALVLFDRCNGAFGVL